MRSRPLPGLASGALVPLLEGSPAPACVRAVARAAVYLEVPAGLLALLDPAATWLPNAVVVAGTDFARLAGAAGTGLARGPAAPARVGGGHVEVAGLVVEVARWWDPRPRVGRVAAAALATARRRLDAHLPAWPDPLAHPRALREPAGEFHAAAVALDEQRACEAVRGLLGLGPGLTPAGDDLVAGAVAAATVFGISTGRPAAVGFGARVAAAALAIAPRATTALSAALLGHAARGELAVPARDVCEAVVGHVELGAAVTRLLATGHTSGHDLARGLLVGLRVVEAAAQVEEAA